jgi:hypothetical protein
LGEVHREKGGPESCHGDGWHHGCGCNLVRLDHRGLFLQSVCFSLSQRNNQQKIAIFIFLYSLNIELLKLKKCSFKALPATVLVSCLIDPLPEYPPLKAHFYQ